MIRETCVGSRILNFFTVLQVGIGGTKVHIPLTDRILPC